MFIVCVPIEDVPLKVPAIASGVGASKCITPDILPWPWSHAIWTSRTVAVFVVIVVLQFFWSVSMPWSNFSLVRHSLIVDVCGPIAPAMAACTAAACCGVILLVSVIGTFPVMFVVEVTSQRPILTLILGAPCATRAAVSPAIMAVVPRGRMERIMGTWLLRRTL